MDANANPALMNHPAYKPQTDDEITVYNFIPRAVAVME